MKINKVKVKVKSMRSIETRQYFNPGYVSDVPLLARKDKHTTFKIIFSTKFDRGSYYSCGGNLKRYLLIVYKDKFHIYAANWVEDPYEVF